MQQNSLAKGNLEGILTSLPGTERVVGAQYPDFKPVYQIRFYLSFFCYIIKVKDNGEGYCFELCFNSIAAKKVWMVTGGECMEKAPYLILAEDAEGEIQEKKSRFIARLHKTDSEEEASSFIQQTKKSYWDARHNCSAFVIGEHHELSRCSDDGEPSGTAGRPMLDLLINSGLHNVTAVVTRYFGGVLLGTGGLVRAYQKAVQTAIDQAHILEMELCAPAEFQIAYTELGRIQNLMAAMQLQGEPDYGENVVISLMLPETKKEKFLKELTELTAGKAAVHIGDSIMHPHERGI